MPIYNGETYMYDNAHTPLISQTLSMWGWFVF